MADPARDHALKPGGPRARAAAALLAAAAATPAAAIDDGGASLSRLILPDGEAAAAQPPLLPGPRAAGSPDAMLRAAAVHWERGEVARAQAQLDRLLALQPDFRAAHFLRAEILAARAGHRASIREKLGAAHAEMAQETRLRLAPAAHDAGRLPAALLRLPPGVQHAIAVDLSAARLYVISRTAEGLRVTRDHYAAMGRAGFGKEREGDNRTPLGVYRILRWMDGDELPALYGSGAFPVNYPNAWDRALGRSGYGIWLHGVPRETYARLPRSSEGCVTLANGDLRALGDVVALGETPVILADRLRWQAPERMDARREGFEARIERWRRAWEQRDTEAYLEHYAADFRDSAGRERTAFAERKRAINAAKRWVTVKLGEMAIYDYPGEDGLRLVRFEQRYASDNYASVSTKQQFWRRQADGEWRIERVFESDERPMPPEALRTAEAAAAARAD